MTPQRRREGRAIRKARRDARRAWESIDWDALTASLEDVAVAMVRIAGAAAEAATALATWWESTAEEFIAGAESYARKVDRATTLVNQDC